MIWADTKAEMDSSEEDSNAARDFVSTAERGDVALVAAAQVYATLSVAAALRALVRIVDEKVSPL